MDLDLCRKNKKICKKICIFKNLLADKSKPFYYYQKSSFVCIASFSVFMIPVIASYSC